MKRYAGVLLPVTSLPSKYGIGCFDQAAYDFVDWLQKAGQRYWQILPLGATSYGSSDDSPYTTSPNDCCMTAGKSRVTLPIFPATA